jgi:hypothetical protein
MPLVRSSITPERYSLSSRSASKVVRGVCFERHRSAVDDRRDRTCGTPPLPARAAARSCLLVDDGPRASKRATGWKRKCRSAPSSVLVGTSCSSAPPPSTDCSIRERLSHKPVRTSTVLVTVGGTGLTLVQFAALSQFQLYLGDIDDCYPADQLMHRVMEWFVRQPRDGAVVSPTVATRLLPDILGSAESSPRRQRGRRRSTLLIHAKAAVLVATPA